MKTVYSLLTGDTYEVIGFEGNKHILWRLVNGVRVGWETRVTQTQFNAFYSNIETEEVTEQDKKEKYSVDNEIEDKARYEFKD